MKAPDSRIAVTLYNLREHCKTESDLDRTLARVREIGYRAVQFSGVSLPAATVRSLLDKNGLYCCAAHSGMAPLLLDDPAPEIEKLKTLECDFVALGSPPEEYIKNYDKTLELIDRFVERGELFLKNGIRLGYHNHAREFTKQAETGKTMLETFYTATRGEGFGQPKVYAEIDVHWVTRGGGSPVRWIWNVNGRMPVVHFKDFVICENEPHFCEIGEGNLDWEAILQACVETNVRWYSIEQDQPFPGRDIFDSIKISYDNLRKMGVR